MTTRFRNQQNNDDNRHRELSKTIIQSNMNSQSQLWKQTELTDFWPSGESHLSTHVIEFGLLIAVFTLYKTALIIIMIIIIIINLIYIAQFDTNGILTALYIVITYIQMQYVHVWTCMKQSYKYTYTCLHISKYTVTLISCYVLTASLAYWFRRPSWERRPGFFVFWPPRWPTGLGDRLENADLGSLCFDRLVGLLV